MMEGEGWTFLLKSRGRGIGFSCLFISLLAQRNEPKKGHPVFLVPPKAGCPEFMPRMGYSSMLPGLCKLGCASNSAKPFFDSLSGARLRANGILTALRAKELTDFAWKAEKTIGAVGKI